MNVAHRTTPELAIHLMADLKEQRDLIYSELQELGRELKSTAEALLRCQDETDAVIVQLEVQKEANLHQAELLRVLRRQLNGQ